MIQVINPATEEVVQQLQPDSTSQIQEKYGRARRAQLGWARKPFSERARCLERFAELMVERADELARQQSVETGKPIRQARSEIVATPARVKFFIEHWEEVLRPRQNVQPGMTEILRYEPLGVVVNISAWNYPWFVGANVFVPALLGGNAVLYKPSEFSPQTGLNIGRLLHEAGVPLEVFQVVLGGGQAGIDLLALPIDGVFFTGSYGTGTKIAQATAGRMIRTQLELGGKDPVYVCEDVDVKVAAEGIADGAFYNNGQSCCSVERIYVHAAIHDSFVQHFVETVRSFRMGSPLEEETYLGPVTRRAQLEVLRDQVEDAVGKGARLETGGKPLSGPGWYFEPTVLTGVSHAMKIMREESFGPVIGIQKVADDAEALRLMNDTEYGLTAGVYTRDRARAEKLMSELNAGSVYWNCCDRVSPFLPWTGRKHSGMGSTLSYLGILAFVQPKGWHLRSS